MTAGAALTGWAAAVVAVVVALVARRSLAMRAEAVARASHELRGPLTATRLGLELGLRLGQLSPARLRALDLELGRAALALDDLVNTPRRRLRGVMSGGRRRAVPPPELVDLQQLLADSVEAWRASASARGLDLRMSWHGRRATVFGERLRLAQATGNLLANAIEHGGGTIEVHGRAGPAGTRIEIVDGGPGLRAPVAELIRASRRQLRGGKGVRGRGLAIADAVAVAHGGCLIAAPSTRGARLVLELPAPGR